MRSLANVLVAAVLLPSMATGAPLVIQPGLYEITATQDGGAPVTDHHCVTPEEAARGFQVPRAQGRCKPVRNTMGGGKVDIAFACTDPGGPGSGVLNTSLSGTYSASGYVMDVRMQGDVAGQALSSVTHLNGKRIADTCQPDTR